MTAIDWVQVVNVQFRVLLLAGILVGCGDGSTSLTRQTPAVPGESAAAGDFLQTSGRHEEYRQAQQLDRVKVAITASPQHSTVEDRDDGR